MHNVRADILGHASLRRIWGRMVLLARVWETILVVMIVCPMTRVRLVLRIQMGREGRFLGRKYTFILLFIATFASIAGCSDVPNSAESSPVAEAASPPFLDLFLSQSGADPTALPNIIPSNSTPWTEMCGGILVRLTLAEYVDVAGTTGIGMVELQGGRLCTILGAVSLDEKRYVQIVRDRMPELVSLHEFDEEQPIGVWCVEPSQQSAVSMNIGETCLSVNKLWHNFGLTRPFGTSSTEFQIKNHGESACKIDLIRTSCSCTVVELGGSKLLEPGQEMNLTARLSMGNRDSVFQVIELLLTDVKGGGARPVILTLFANRMPVVSVIPDSVDFGTVRNQDHPVHRNVRLLRTIHDRFRVEKTWSDHACIAARVDTLPGGQAASKVGGSILDIVLTPGQLTTGLHECKLHVATTSPYRPSITIPVKWEVPAPCVAVPGVAAFGLVSVGESKAEQIRLVAENGEQFSAEVKTALPDCDARIVESNGDLILVVTPHFEQTGMFDRTLVVRVVAKSWSRDISVRCGAVVKAK